MGLYTGWMEGNKKHLEWSIKFTTKNLIAQLLLLAFNIGGVLFNAWCLYKGEIPSAAAASGIGLGAFASNGLWTLGFICKIWGEIRQEKTELKFIREIELKENLDEDRKMYLACKNNFDTIVAGYKIEIERLQSGIKNRDDDAKSRLGKSNKGWSKSVGSSGTGIQPTPGADSI